jgi:hypothetical protein
MIRDYFGSGAFSGPRAHHTDGVWVWPGTLSFYVEKYRVELPPDFIERMAALDWTCPKLSAEERAALARPRRAV